MIDSQDVESNFIHAQFKSIIKHHVVRHRLEITTTSSALFDAINCSLAWSTNAQIELLLPGGGMWHVGVLGALCATLFTDSR